MKLRRFDVLTLDSMRTVHGIELGFAFGTPGSKMWVATKSKDSPGLRFWGQTYDMRFRVPDDLSPDEEILVGIKGAERVAAWNVEDFGDRFLILKKKTLEGAKHG